MEPLSEDEVDTSVFLVSFGAQSRPCGLHKAEGSGDQERRNWSLKSCGLPEASSHVKMEEPRAHESCFMRKQPGQVEVVRGLSLKPHEVVNMVGLQS